MARSKTSVALSGRYGISDAHCERQREAIMRKINLFLAAAVLCAIPSLGQQSPAAPQEAVAQTPRQALMEMFFNKTPGTFIKHLPAVTRAALEKSGALAMLQQYSHMASQVSTNGNKVQTFETGEVFVSGEDPKTGQKYEVTVVNDAARGDEDDIELSFRSYKDGQPQRSPFMPRMVFTMKKEAQIWTLNEVSFTIHVPLADPDFLKAITEKMQPQAVTRTSFTPQGETSVSLAGGDPMVIAAMRSILKAENTYASSYSTVGFTCTLSNLDGFGAGEPNEHQAMLINSSLAGGRRYGFVFKLSECSGAPATAFHLVAVPNENVYGRKAFCADQSGIIRSTDDGNPATCFASGTPIP
jgi:hypothetical protein